MAANKVRKGTGALLVVSLAVTALFTTVAAPAAAAESLSVPYGTGINGCNGSARNDGTNKVAPSPAGKMRVMAFNIAEARSWDHLHRVAGTISNAQPDIVLLNEVMCRHWDSPSNIASALAQLSGYASYAYEDATWTGGAGTKGVAILSKFPLVDTRMHIVQHDGRATGFGTLDATIRIGSVNHRVLSTRYSPMHPVGTPAYTPNEAPENRAGHLQALDLSWGIPSATPVIFGGDFNASWIARPDNFGQHVWSQQFRDSSALKDVLGNGSEGRVDYLYYRGRFHVSNAVLQAVSPEVSDHAFVLADLITETVQVPKVVGAEANQAAAILTSAGLAVQQREKADPYCTKIGTVLAQSPSGGTTVYAGSTVTIWVGTEPDTPCF